jgi:OOP family OmpA-OmpF porin
MKKITSLLVVFFAVFIMAANGLAEVKAQTYSFTPFVGLYTFGKDYEGLKNQAVSGLRLGYDITKNWGVEGSFEYLKTEYSDPTLTSSTNVFSYRLETLYHLYPERRLSPHLAVGAGGRSVSYKHELMNDRNHAVIDYGAGLKYFLYSNIALRVDVRHLILLNDDINNVEYTVGATIYFGGPKQPTVPVIVDSDNDGVSDNYDKCPGTPIGVKVDQDGCPLDSDKDGVPDYLDKCPGTPLGVKVDQDGCPLDSDKDGVPDYLDKCPGTPAGMKVDKDGCPPPMEQLQEFRAEAPAAAAKVETKEAAAAAAVAKEMFEKGRATIKVEFDTNKANIKPAFDKELQKFADVMKNYPDLKVVIEGHTDNVGGKVPNEKLSAKRANSVKDYLTKKFGIAESRLTAKGYGMSKPIASNKTKAGRQTNRRVEAAVDYQKIKK